MADKREFDLILFGATGFVGRLTAEYLAGAAPESARIALAGRSLEKLTKLRADLGAAAAEWGLVVADVADQGALDTLAARTTIVVTTVGPYQRYGMPLVAACAQAGTHYADLTGESIFIREAIDQFHDQAVATGAKIVNSCGFDSIPSDLSVYQLYRSAIADGSGELEDTTLIATTRGGVSGGTIDSARAMWEVVAADPSKRSVISDPYSLSPDRSLDPNVGRQSDHALQRAKTIAPQLEGWVATFVMAPHNTKLVRRSNGLLGGVYGKNFRFREVMDAGNSWAAPMIAAAVAGGIVGAMAAGAALSRLSAGRRLLDRVLPKPGTGPNEKSRADGWFTMKTYTRTSSGAEYVATFASTGDPGYQATAMMLGESGLCLAFDGAKLPRLAGIVTPATAMGDALTDRMRAAGIAFEVQRSQ